MFPLRFLAEHARKDPPTAHAQPALICRSSKTKSTRLSKCSRSSLRDECRQKDPPVHARSVNVRQKLKETVFRLHAVPVGATWRFHWEGPVNSPARWDSDSRTLCQVPDGLWWSLNSTGRLRWRRKCESATTTLHPITFTQF